MTTTTITTIIVIVIIVIVVIVVIAVVIIIVVVVIVIIDVVVIRLMEIFKEHPTTKKLQKHSGKTTKTNNWLLFTISVNRTTVTTNTNIKLQIHNYSEQETTMQQ